MKVIIQPSAKRDLKKLDKGIIETILRKIYSIRADPIAHVFRLKSSALWKLRIGDYRVIIRIDTGAQEMHVIKIGHRNNIYKSR